MTDLIVIKDLTKTFNQENGVRKTVLKNLSLTIPFYENGNITSIIAPFGAGKSTLLKIISGIEKYDSGNLNFHNSVLKIKPFIPQSNSILPWLSVKENITHWLKLKNEKVSDDKLNQIIGDVGLTNYENYYPQNINSGFQFRIVFARALVFNSKIILIDSAFNNFDLDTRNEIYTMLKFVVDKYRLQIILTTTNIIEAIYLSEKIYLMSKNPAEIFFELKNENKFNELQTMVTSESFKFISQQIQSEFQTHSGITLIHYLV
jgi:ABC-type nitrate/sulfonate/bicarbonate transport system ATPase subunit